MSAETYVDEITPGAEYKTVIGFVSYAAYARWDKDPKVDKILEPLDALVGPHKHYLSGSNPLFRGKRCKVKFKLNLGLSP